MAPDPKCAALSAAMANKGLNYAQVAGKIGQSEQHVIDICTGNAQPTDAEYNALAAALDIRAPVPNDASHTRK